MFTSKTNLKIKDKDKSEKIRKFTYIQKWNKKKKRSIIRKEKRMANQVISLRKSFIVAGQGPGL